MKRRNFITKSSAGLMFAIVAPGMWASTLPKARKREIPFERYDPAKSLVPVTRVTPGDGFYVHTYYDVCPFSPSGRYLVVSRLPYEDHYPRFGDTADVCVIDLQERTLETVYTTKSWGHQTGTLAQWGATDRHIYTNDVIDGRAVCVEIDLETRALRALEGPLYHISPDGQSIVSFPLELMDITQRGYGVAAKDYDNPPTLPKGAAADEGIWKTDIRTGRKSLLVSLRQVAEKVPAPPPRNDGTFYFWHSKYNLQGTRIMQVLRCLFPDGSGEHNVNVFTYDIDGTDIVRTFSEPIWGHGGGHPNWHPDGKHLLRNLNPDGGPTRLCKVPLDGGKPEILSHTIDGGGHPTIEPTERYIVTDAMYLDPDPVVRIRLIDIVNQTEKALCLMPTKPLSKQLGRYQELRLDGHPTWDRAFKRICFQGAPAGGRQLFVADLTSLV